MAAVASTNVFVYNRRSEITGATMRNESSLYDYDWQGNRLTATNGATGAVYIPDGLNQYDAVDDVEPVYDLDGNLLEIPGRMAMEYDAKNQMTFCSNANYRVWNTYDHLGRRIGKTVSGAYDSHYLYDGWNLIAETMPSALPSHFLWGLDLSGSEQGVGGVGGLLGVYQNGSWYVPLFDANGNITAYVDESGAVVAHYDYDAFGGTIAQSGFMADAFAHRFSTKFQDTETGLLYYGYRYYDPAWGRWINRDPIEEDGGLNLYGFCGNDGVNAVDAWGEDFIAVGARTVKNTARLFNHMSIVYFESSCNPKEEYEFSPKDFGKGDVSDVFGEYERWELLRDSEVFVRYSGPRWTERQLQQARKGVFPAPPVKTRLEPVAISKIVKNDPDFPTVYKVILSDANIDDWDKVVAASQSYPYAEFPNPDFPKHPLNWPNSKYEFPPLLFGGGNNSNTFIFEMAEVLTRRNKAIRAFWNTPGNNRAEPVPDDGGRTPFRKY